MTLGKAHTSDDGSVQTMAVLPQWNAPKSTTNVLFSRKLSAR